MPAARLQKGLTFKKTQEDWADFAIMQKTAALKDYNQGQDPQVNTVGSILSYLSENLVQTFTKAIIG
ncbi:hypothetical protein llap_8277 [Limosa lapponica baueri]|uniref:Uncharacterized protein n=1 Tax=Limosa lapponica baueri TaxID=1758121 RepID=A0A2I0U5W9_LIMLA|nr:hypothetical protein llap_8277 [Limosa lapponica baueri]